MKQNIADELESRWGRRDARLDLETTGNAQIRDGRFPFGRGSWIVGANYAGEWCEGFSRLIGKPFGRGPRAPHLSDDDWRVIAEFINRAMAPTCCDLAELDRALYESFGDDDEAEETNP